MLDIPDLIRRYEALKDRDLRREGCFICEGRNLVHRLLSSTWETESVLCAKRFAGEFREAAAGRCLVFEMEEEKLSEIIGFQFHRGVLACGIRKPLPEVQALPDILTKARTVVVLPDLTNQENVGGIIRCADALNVDAAILGNQCADPFGRKALKTSMGSVFRVPLFSSAIPEHLATLKDSGFTLVGTVASSDAVPLPNFSRPPKTAILIGGEADGLSTEWEKVCDVLLTIPMRPGIDSLNAAVAAGIVLFQINTLPAER